VSLHSSIRLWPSQEWTPTDQADVGRLEHAGDCVRLRKWSVFVPPAAQPQVLTPGKCAALDISAGRARAPRPPHQARLLWDHRCTRAAVEKRHPSAPTAASTSRYQPPALALE